jgi:hypothetical protein
MAIHRPTCRRRAEPEPSERLRELIPGEEVLINLSFESTMKPSLPPRGLFVVCAAGLRGAASSPRAGRDQVLHTGEVYAEMLSGVYNGLVEGMPPRGVIWLALLSVTAVLAAAFPVLFVGLTQWWPSPESRGAIRVAAGILAVIGAGSNFLAMLVSHLTIGFGVSSSSQGETAFIWIIPAFQALFGLASIVAGWSDRFAGWLNHCLN